jgi:hypothetical protein
MRLVHSITMASFVTMVACVSACSDSGDDGASNNGGSGGTSPTGGTAGAAGSATSGTGGSGTSGAAGSGTSGASGGGALDHPTDTTQAGIEAFLAAESYKTMGMGWRPESMPASGTGVPHGAVKRYFNETIIASKAAGNAPPTMQHTAGSMSVKEILDGTTVVGKATMLRTDSMWIYYCTSSMEGRCYTGSAAGSTYYGTTAGSCACHGSGVNLSSMAIPAP